jgi:hypothetical protein
VVARKVLARESGVNLELVLRTSPKEMSETPRAQKGPQSDTRDLWRRW